MLSILDRMRSVGNVKTALMAGDQEVPSIDAVNGDRDKRVKVDVIGPPPPDRKVAPAPEKVRRPMTLK
jgi:hypothetical protein